jgi:hypothetical protein
MWQVRVCGHNPDTGGPEKCLGLCAGTGKRLGVVWESKCHSLLEFGEVSLDWPRRVCDVIYRGLAKRPKMGIHRRKYPSRVGRTEGPFLC